MRAPPLPALLALAVLLSGCLGERIDPAAQEGALPEGHEEHHATPAPAQDLGPPDVSFEAHAGTPESDVRLHPGTLRASRGDVVEIRVTNAGASTHSYMIHAFGVNSGALSPGESRTVKFVASEPGTFEVMCDTPGHYQAGMKAVLEVAA